MMSRVSQTDGLSHLHRRHGDFIFHPGCHGRAPRRRGGSGFVRGHARSHSQRSEKSSSGRGAATRWPAGTAGYLAGKTSASARAEMVATIKEELKSEMGLVPLQLLRDRRSSFVELYSYDNFGKTNYGTAGYLGGGYFITVKHAVVALPKTTQGRTAARSCRSRSSIGARRSRRKSSTTGDADAEVHSGDWAIIKTARARSAGAECGHSYAYDFADPIFRLGNDYSKGIILSTGYVGQRTANGLVTCLTDGHPGVSGGGVLDQRGNLVGIPVGRMQGDYRFSFILPLRPEMLRKVPVQPAASPATAIAANVIPR